MHVGRDVIGDGDVAGDVPVVETGLVALRGEDAALVGGQRRVGAVGDHRDIGAVLLVIVQAQAR